MSNWFARCLAGCRSWFTAKYEALLGSRKSKKPKVGCIRMQARTWVGDRCIPTVSRGIRIEVDLPARFRVLNPKTFRASGNPPFPAFYCSRHPDPKGELYWVEYRKIVLYGVTYRLQEAPVLTIDRYLEFSVYDE